MFRSSTSYPLPTLPSSIGRLRSLWNFVLPHLGAVFSAVGAVCGMGGTALLASHPTQTTAVFALYSASAAAWMTVGLLTRQRWLMASNIAYLMLALKGLLL
ncbi:MAG TPA: hypothetical protein VIT67_06180 [Povalibacter sp.]